MLYPTEPRAQPYSRCQNATRLDYRRRRTDWKLSSPNGVSVRTENVCCWPDTASTRSDRFFGSGPSFPREPTTTCHSLRGTYQEPCLPGESSTRVETECRSDAASGRTRRGQRIYFLFHRPRVRWP